MFDRPVGMTELSDADLHPRLFDDWKSFLHAALGFISVILPKPIGFCIALFFFFYELIEPDENALSDIIEYAIGFILGSLLF